MAAARQDAAFDSITQTISALAALDATDRWVMTAALTGVGLAHVTTALALRGAAVPGRVILATGGLATMFVAAFALPTVLGDGGSTPHSIAAGISFGALAIWPAFALRGRSPGAQKWQVPLGLRPKVALAATVVLVAGVGWFVSDLGQEGSPVGLSERVSAGAQAIWPLLAVLSTRRDRS